MNKHILVFCAVIASIFSSAAEAQDALDCPSVIIGNGLPENAVPDFIHQPIVQPGSFGGNVVCFLSREDDQIVQYFVEFLPFDGNFDYSVFYRSTKISIHARPQGEQANQFELAYCEVQPAGGLICGAEYSLGNGFNVVWFFDANNQITNVMLIAILKDGLINPDRWALVRDNIGTDALAISVYATLPENDFSLELGIFNDAGQWVFGAQGDAAEEFLTELNSFTAPVVIDTELREYSETAEGSQLRDSTQNFNISVDILQFVTARATEINRLMANRDNSSDE